MLGKWLTLTRYGWIWHCCLIEIFSKLRNVAATGRGPTRGTAGPAQPPPPPPRNSPPHKAHHQRSLAPCQTPSLSQPSGPSLRQRPADIKSVSRQFLVAQQLYIPLRLYFFSCLSMVHVMQDSELYLAKTK